MTQMIIDPEESIARRIIWPLVEGETEPLLVQFEDLVLNDYDSIKMNMRNEDRSVFVRTVVPTAAAASDTDTTSYPVADQDGLTEKVTIDSGAEQTVTFSGATTTASSVATQMDAQLTGCSVAVVAGQVVITTDTRGSASSVAIGAGTGALVWATPVAGVGDDEVGSVTWLSTDLVEGRHQAEFEFTLGTEVFKLPRKFAVEFSVRGEIG